MNTPPASRRQHSIQEFLARCQLAHATLFPLAGDASFRRYIRIRLPDSTSRMLMDAPPEKESVRQYLDIARYLYRQGYSAPHIIAEDEAAGLLLLEDFGDDSFTRVLGGAVSSQKQSLEMEFYTSAIDLLVKWHSAEGLANPAQLPLMVYDEALLLKEVRLFADWFLPQAIGKEKAMELTPEYMELWRGILTAQPLSQRHFVHRDYHADNLMWLPERALTARVGLLDFQDAVYGDAAYDMVSLLEDARRDIEPALAQAMLARYMNAMSLKKEDFMRAYAVLAAQRNCKIIGIFSRLAARDGKHHYLSLLPRVWGYLEQDLKHPALAPLKSWMDRHVPSGARGVITIRCTAEELALTA